MSEFINIEEIEGIGPAYSEMLSSVDIYDTIDLLYHTALQIYDWFQSSISQDQATTWRAMANLLQIQAITPQYAEALVKSEIQTMEDLQALSLSDATQIFEDARNNSLIPDIPTADQICLMIKEATTIENTGLLNGTIVNDDGLPLSNVTLAVGNLKAETNARGRFRLLEIPLGRPVRLMLEHEDLGVRILDNPILSLDNEVVSNTTISFNQDSEPLTDMDEYLGEILPIHNEITFTTQHQDADQLRDLDLLFVQDFYENGQDVKLASRNRAYINGKIVIRTYRVALTALPSDIQRLDNIIYKNGTFEKAPKTVTPWLNAFNSLRKELTEKEEPADMPAKLELINNILMNI